MEQYRLQDRGRSSRSSRPLPQSPSLTEANGTCNEFSKPKMQFSLDALNTFFLLLSDSEQAVTAQFVRKSVANCSGDVTSVVSQLILLCEDSTEDVKDKWKRDRLDKITHILRCILKQAGAQKRVNTIGDVGDDTSLSTAVKSEQKIDQPVAKSEAKKNLLRLRQSRLESLIKSKVYFRHSDEGKDASSNRDDSSQISSYLPTPGLSVETKHCATLQREPSIIRNAHSAKMGPSFQSAKGLNAAGESTLESRQRTTVSHPPQSVINHNENDVGKSVTSKALSLEELMRKRDRRFVDVDEISQSTLSTYQSLPHDFKRFDQIYEGASMHFMSKETYGKNSIPDSDSDDDATETTCNNSSDMPDKNDTPTLEEVFTKRTRRFVDVDEVSLSSWSTANYSTELCNATDATDATSVRCVASRSEKEKQEVDRTPKVAGSGILVSTRPVKNGNTISKSSRRDLAMNDFFHSTLKTKNTNPALSCAFHEDESEGIASADLDAIFTPPAHENRSECLLEMSSSEETHSDRISVTSNWSDIVGQLSKTHYETVHILTPLDDDNNNNPQCRIEQIRDVAIISEAPTTISNLERRLRVTQNDLTTLSALHEANQNEHCRIQQMCGVTSLDEVPSKISVLKQQLCDSQDKLTVAVRQAAIDETNRNDQRLVEQMCGVTSLGEVLSTISDLKQQLYGAQNELTLLAVLNEEDRNVQRRIEQICGVTRLDEVPTKMADLEQRLRDTQDDLTTLTALDEANQNEHCRIQQLCGVTSLNEVSSKISDMKQQLLDSQDEFTVAAKQWTAIGECNYNEQRRLEQMCGVTSLGEVPSKISDLKQQLCDSHEEFIGAKRQWTAIDEDNRNEQRRIEQLCGVSNLCDLPSKLLELEKCLQETRDELAATVQSNSELVKSTCEERRRMAQSCGVTCLSEIPSKISELDHCLSETQNELKEAQRKATVEERRVEQLCGVSRIDEVPVKISGLETRLADALHELKTLCASTRSEDRTEHVAKACEASSHASDDAKSLIATRLELKVALSKCALLEKTMMQTTSSLDKANAEAVALKVTLARLQPKSVSHDQSSQCSNKQLETNDAIYSSESHRDQNDHPPPETSNTLLFQIRLEQKELENKMLTKEKFELQSQLTQSRSSLWDLEEERNYNRRKLVQLSNLIMDRSSDNNNETVLEGRLRDMSVSFAEAQGEKDNLRLVIGRLKQSISVLKTENNQKNKLLEVFVSRLLLSTEDCTESLRTDYGEMMAKVTFLSVELAESNMTIDDLKDRLRKAEKDLLENAAPGEANKTPPPSLLLERAHLTISELISNRFTTKI